MADVGGAECGSAWERLQLPWYPARGGRKCGSHFRRGLHSDAAAAAMGQDYYAVLELRRSATDAEIKKA